VSTLISFRIPLYCNVDKLTTCQNFRLSVAKRLSTRRNHVPRNESAGLTNGMAEQSSILWIQTLGETNSSGVSADVRWSLDDHTERTPGGYFVEQLNGGSLAINLQRIVLF
jgi:hypothetical protein